MATVVFVILFWQQLRSRGHLANIISNWSRQFLEANKSQNESIGKGLSGVKESEVSYVDKNSRIDDYLTYQGGEYFEKEEVNNEAKNTLVMIEEAEENMNWEKELEEDDASKKGKIGAPQL